MSRVLGAQTLGISGLGTAFQRCLLVQNLGLRVPGSGLRVFEFRAYIGVLNLGLSSLRSKKGLGDLLQEVPPGSGHGLIRCLSGSCPLHCWACSLKPCYKS